MASSGHSRSLSAPVYKPSLDCWEFLRSTVVVRQDGNKWSCTSDGDGRIEERARLERDVQELQIQLNIETGIRKSLEKALTSPCEPLSEETYNLSPQTKELIRDIASLENEVVYLEQHVLSLYRKVFDSKVKRVQKQLFPAEQKNPHLSPTHPKIPHKPRKSQSVQHRRFSSHGCHSMQDAVSCTPSKTRHGSLLGGQPQEQDSRVYPPELESSLTPSKHRNSLNLHDSTNKQMTPLTKQRNVSNLHDTPNKLSEQMVRCMAAIYCRLADPPLPFIGDALLSPPSSTTTSSPTNVSSSDAWSPNSAASDTHCSMIEVPWIRVDKERLTYAAQALRSFRLLVEKLEQVRPGDMKHDEKLAFWINVYNALVMHAYLAYGIPRSHLKKVSLLQKAAYKVGAYSINAYTIEHSILGCRSQRPAQWLQTLFGPLTKFRNEERRAYALDTPEPLVCFALCCGGRSDPAVRVYGPKTVKYELESAKRDFMLAQVSRKNNKVYLPRLLESYARDQGLSHHKLLEWISEHVLDKQKSGKSGHYKSRHLHAEWLPYDFSFRYIFVRELAR